VIPDQYLSVDILLPNDGQTEAIPQLSGQQGNALIELVYGVEIIGPVAQDPSWQSRDMAGFDKSAFAIDWEAKVATCSAGMQRISWLPITSPASGVDFEALFSGRDFTLCSFRSQSTRSKQEPPIISLQARDLHEALQTMRKR
jgi:transposase